MGILGASKASAAVDGYCVMEKFRCQAAAIATASPVMSPVRAPLARTSSSLSRSGASFCSWGNWGGNVYSCVTSSISQLSWPGDTSIAAVAWQ